MHLLTFSSPLDQPFLKKFKLHDTCGVNNLHGIPGIMGTILSVIFAAMADEKTYKHGYVFMLLGTIM